MTPASTHLKVSMSPRHHPLSPQQARLRADALQHLAQGQAQQALALARTLVAGAASSADAQLLLAITLSETGADREAELAFVRASALLPNSDVVAQNHAAWLGRMNRVAEAIALLSRFPRSAGASRQLGLLLQQQGDIKRSVETLRRAVTIDPASGDAWRALGSALRASDKLESAEEAFAKACATQSANADNWFNRGAVLRLLGQIEASMSCMQQARALGDDRPELHNAINGLLADAGRVGDALAGAKLVARRFPSFVQGLETLAQMSWEYSPTVSTADDVMAPLRAASAAQPANRSLSLALVRLQMQAGQFERALDRVERSRLHPADPVADWISAECLGGLGQHDEADIRFRRAAVYFGDQNVDFLNAHIRHCLNTQRIDQAMSLATLATSRYPDHQESWAHMSTLWRLAGDEREHWLCDYQAHVADLELSLPKGFAKLERFLDALSDVLDPLHGAYRQPLGQSVRNGSQTSGRLLGRNDPTLMAFHAAIQTTVTGWLARLPDDARHPFLRRKQQRTRVVGSWSVKLQSGGHHSQHIHPDGWLSSAFYVSVPETPADDTAGWLALGQPLGPIGAALSPRRLIRAVPGRLALFPSYFWHGTIAFQSAQPRLTAAFDLQPAER